MIRRLPLLALTCCLLAALVTPATAAPPSGVRAASTAAPAAAADDRSTTAWRGGRLQVDVDGLVSRSDVILEGPSWRPFQSMPIGNGRLGAAVWAEEGFTAQLNRVDLFPDLKSPGQLVVPGLDALMRAPDYRGRLDLHDATLRQSGGGITVDTYVHAERDLLVVEVTGADPDQRQTAELRLWNGRSPEVVVSDGIAALAEEFTDSASGERFGAVAAVTAMGRDVTAEQVGERSVEVTFLPEEDGSFRIVTGVPFSVDEDPAAAALAAVEGATGSSANELAQGHRDWWHSFYQGLGHLRLQSDNGEAEYLETLRLLTLYTTAASMRGELPASHGAVINLFSAFRDASDWSPADYWHFNQRMQVNANFAAGAEELNAPYYRLYRDNLETILDWTREHMPGTEGACISEVLRFDGTGSYGNRRIQCDSASPPGYVERILSTGPEIAHNMWRHYRYTGDEAFLDEHYPLMREVVRFYLTYATEDENGFLQIEHANSLENQWDTTNPAPDLAAMRVLFPLVADLAAERGDGALAAQLRAAIPKLPPFRLVQRNGEEVIAWSATDEPSKNSQNPDLEAVWPWGLFGDGSGEGDALAARTFRNRVYPQAYDWGMDATWAARLGLPGEVRSLLLQGVRDFQIYPNGFSFFGKGGNPAQEDSFYQEHNGVIAVALHEALVQSYDGLVRVAPAWPAQWSADAALQIEGGHRLSTRIRGGRPLLVGLEAGSSGTVRVRNPWPGEEVRVVDGRTGRGRPVVGPSAAEVVEIPVVDGRSYLLERAEHPYPSFGFEPVRGHAATEVKELGARTIGVVASEAPPSCVRPPEDRPLQVSWSPQSGDAITDSSEYGRHAVVAGGGRYADGPDGPALVLDGQRYIRSAEDVTLGRLEEATFEAQVRVRSSAGYRRLFDYIPIGNGGTEGFLVDLAPGNAVRFIGGGVLTQTDLVVPSDRFVHLAVTVADGEVRVYLDGQLGWQGDVGVGTFGCFTGALQFGADQAGGSRFIGEVGDVRVWSERRPPTPAP